jgi:hypothetical protein
MHLTTDPLYVTWKLYIDRCDDESATNRQPITTEASNHEAKENVGDGAAEVASDINHSISTSVSCMNTENTATVRSCGSQLEDVIAAFTNSSARDNCDSDILVYPEHHIRKKSSRRTEDKYFILTKQLLVLPN